MKWQPIETAPKDGFHILLYRPEIIMTGFWGDSGWYSNSRGLSEIKNPTHWMPLPKLPEDV